MLGYHWLFGLACLALGAGCVLVHLWRIAPVAAAFKAKIVCSALFVSGRRLEDVLAQDVGADSYRLLRLFRVRVDPERKAVTGSWLGLRPRTAVCRPGFGACLLEDGSPPVEAALARMPSLPFPGREKPWPIGEGAPQRPAGAGVPGAVERAVEGAFAEPAPAKPRRTRAVVVVHDGRIVAERYAPGFGPDMPLPGWSMTKSVMNALVGILAGQGKLSVERGGLLGAWRGPGDARAGITVDDLLRMRSGLEFRESYSDPLQDVTRMLFASPDAAAYAAAKPLAARPGTVWSYSSGSTNILSRVARQALGGTWEDYLGFPRRALFDRIGMRSAVMEIDAAGDFVASSFMYATARDWARFGLLYASDGVWLGERILPEGWVGYSAAPTPQSPGLRYGAHWWLKLHRELGGDSPAAARIPQDAFFALGHEGQAVAVVPSRKLVVVRLGLAVVPDAWDEAAFLASVLEGVGDRLSGQ
ncbi:MAG: serine hydrolase [Elusimicrobia bacterium]|nr:serine hydrolase [Elusimicrobiota bacterium]